MDALAFYRKIPEEVFLEFCFLLDFQVLIFDFSDFTPDVGHDKKVLVLVLRDHLDTLIGKFDLIVFLIDHEEEFGVHLGHFAVVVLHVKILGLLQELLDAFFTQEFDQGFVFGKAPMDP